MTFNIETKTGKLGGGVRMVIHNLAAISGEKPEAPTKPTIETKPKEEQKK